MKKLIQKLMKRPGFYDKTDPTPPAIPLKWKRPPTLQEQVARMVHSEQFKQYMEREGFETIDEAEDFEVGDDYVPEAPHELVYDHDLGKEVSKREKANLDRDREKFDNYARQELAKKRAAKKEKKEEAAPPDPKKKADQE